jgi:branched-chain amino acid aminotransferase
VIVISGKIQLYPGELYEKGMPLITVPTTRNFANAINPAIKSLNYLNNILAKIEAKIGGCEEAIMLNPSGNVAECTGDNVFILSGGQLLTPPLSAGALRGITRGVVIDLAAQMGLEVREPDLTRYDLYNADECFITGTAAEIAPVALIDGRVIGRGRPGPVTRKFMAAYHALTNSEGETI